MKLYDYIYYLERQRNLLGTIIEQLKSLEEYQKEYDLKDFEQFANEWGKFTTEKPKVEKVDKDVFTNGNVTGQPYNPNENLWSNPETFKYHPDVNIWAKKRHSLN